MHKPHPKRVLMLGASGKLGRMMLAVWAQEGAQEYEIIPVYRADCPGGAVRWAPGDGIMHLPRVDVVLALWGVTSGDEDALRANSDLALQAMALGDDLGASRVLHCSSAAVYAPGDAPSTEQTPPAPAGAYGQAKLRMERVVQSADRRAAQLLLRIGNVAGAESLFGNMKPGGPIRLDRFADGAGPQRSYIAPHCLARVFAALFAPGALDGVLNIGAPQPTAMADIARAAGCDITWQTAPAHAVQRMVMDTARLQSVCPLPETKAQPEWLIQSARRTGCWP